MPNRATFKDRWSVVQRVFNEDATRSHNLDQKNSGGPRLNPKPRVVAGGTGSVRAIDHGWNARRGRAAIPAPATKTGLYEANRPLVGNAFCPRLDNNGASARLASCSRSVEGL
jgi:hypothetical protein